MGYTVGHQTGRAKTARRIAVRPYRFFSLLMVCTLASFGWGQRPAARRTAPAIRVMAAQAEGSTSLQFVSAAEGAAFATNLAGHGSLDLGRVSHEVGARVRNVQTQKRNSGFVVSTRFGLNVVNTSRHSGSATLLASLAYPEHIYAVSIDGIRLQTTPQIVNGKLPVGVISQHRLEIDVPSTVTEKDSQLHNSILFQTIPN